MGKKNILICFLLLASLAHFGQPAKEIRADSLRMKLAADSARIYRKTLAKLFLKLEDRYSFISNEHVNLFGLMSGITLHNHHTFFLGYFFMDPRRDSPISFEGIKPNTQHYLDMRYFVFGYQYVVFTKRYWQLNMPLALGYGTYKVDVTDDNNNHLSTRTGRVLPTNAGFQLIFRPIRWAGVSASGGYRYIGQKENTELSLRGWYYSFGIWLDGRYVTRYLRYGLRRRQYHKAMRRL